MDAVGPAYEVVMSTTFNPASGPFVDVDPSLPVM
jgi:hypothetical protein